MKKLAAGILTFLAFFSFMIFAQPIDVTGTWELTMQSPRGERTSEIVIEQDNNNIKVTMAGRQGGETTGEGTIDGKKIEWTITRETPRGEFSMTYIGTVQGDTMTGEIELRQQTMEWTAKKK